MSKIKTTYCNPPSMQKVFLQCTTFNVCQHQPAETLNLFLFFLTVVHLCLPSKLHPIFPDALIFLKSKAYITQKLADNLLQDTVVQLIKYTTNLISNNQV